MKNKNKKANKNDKRSASKPKNKVLVSKKVSKPIKATKAVAKSAKVLETKKTIQEQVKSHHASQKPIKESKKKKGSKSEETNKTMGELREEIFFDNADLLEEFKNKSQEELEEIRLLLGEKSQIDDEEVEIALRDAEGRLYCKMRDCDELSIVDGYCRFHYLKLWKRIQLRKKILTDGKLEKFIEELTQRYPDKYIEMIRDDLKSEKAFLSAIQELEIEDMNDDIDMEGEDDSLIEEVRGMQSSGGGDDEDGF